MNISASAIRMAGMLALAATSVAAANSNQVFTLPAAERAKLLSEVRAVDKVRLEEQAAPGGFVLVRGGVPASTIVSGESADAAKLLQEWVKLMSGAELPIVAADPGQGNRIYIGTAAVAAGLDLSGIQSKSSEGIRIRCDGAKLLVGGQSGAATLRAVTRLLETAFGCRWFADTEWGRHYPERKDLAVGKIDITEEPGMLYRRLWGAEGAFRNNTWLTWNGHGGTELPMSHSWGGILADEDFEKHPEWFRLDENGKRVKGHWLNIGHPEVRKRFMEWSVRASDNGHKGLSFSPPDDHREDFSPESKAYDNSAVIDPSSGRVSMTDRFLLIVNEAATKLYALDRGPIHGFYAYSDYTLPPTRKELDKLSPNLAVWIAPIRYSRYHPLGHPNSPSTQLLKEIVDGWSSRATMLGWRSYNYNLAEVMTPYARITSWSYDLPYLHKHGCVGNSLESFNDWELYAPHLYLSIRLSYDPRLDPWRIMADYWDKAYGPAAESMEAYWMAIDQAFVGLKTETGSYHALHLVYTPAFLATLEKTMASAEQLVKRGTVQQRDRVEIAHRGLTRATYWRRWYDAVNSGDVQTAMSTYDEWNAFVLDSLKQRNVNKYAETYLRRFIGNNLRRAHAAVYPEGQPVNKVVALLPDEWKTATREEIAARGGGEPWKPGYDDAAWAAIKTYSNTRNAQGLPEYFGEMWYRTMFAAPRTSRGLTLHFYKIDRLLTLYINGQRVNETPVEGFNGQATLDVSRFIKPGQDNQITAMIEHVPLPEMFLGGLVHPVYLIEKGQ